MIIKNAAIIIPAEPLTPHLPSAQPAQWSAGPIRHMRTCRTVGSFGISL